MHHITLNRLSWELCSQFTATESFFVLVLTPQTFAVSSFFGRSLKKKKGGGGGGEEQTITCFDNLVEGIKQVAYCVSVIQSLGPHRHWKINTATKIAQVNYY